MARSYNNKPLNNKSTPFMLSDDEVIRVMQAFTERLARANSETYPREKLALQMELHRQIKRWLDNRLDIKIGLNAGGPLVDGLLEPSVLLPFLFIEHPDLSEKAKRTVQRFVDKYQEADRDLRKSATRGQPESKAVKQSPGLAGTLVLGHSDRAMTRASCASSWVLGSNGAENRLKQISSLPNDGNARDSYGIGGSDSERNCATGSGRRTPDPSFGHGRLRCFQSCAFHLIVVAVQHLPICIHEVHLAVAGRKLVP